MTFAKKNVELAVDAVYAIMDLLYIGAACSIVGSNMNPIIKLFAASACMHHMDDVDIDEIKKRVVKKFVNSPESEEEKKPVKKFYTDEPKGQAQCRIGF